MYDGMSFICDYIYYIQKTNFNIEKAETPSVSKHNPSASFSGKYKWSNQLVPFLALQAGS